MDPFEELDRRGRALLAALAIDPEDEDCRRAFDDLYYKAVWTYLKVNRDKLPARVARYLKVDGVVAPDVLPDEVDEVAHEATKIALRRVREKAARFDPARGTPTMWVIGSAEYAYIEVAKSIVTARRSDRLVFVDPVELLDEPDAMSTEEHVLRHLGDEAALEDASNQVSEKEFAALRLVVTAGYSYEEAATMIFGEASMTRQVDGLLTRGKRKLAEAWIDRKPSPYTAGGTNVPDRTDDKEETDG